jgi:cellobiose transport system substrate-binding protein
MTSKMILPKMAVAAVVATMALGTVAPAQAVDDGKTHIAIDSFGDVFLGSMIRQYQSDHPNIVIDVKKYNLDDLNGTGLTTGCASGKTADIAAIEVAYAGYWRTQPQCFKDLRTLSTTDGAKSADDIKADYLAWRWSQGTGIGGAQFGIPTDVGGLEVAYRWDLYKKAGLAYKRDEVSKMWAAATPAKAWDKFIAVGKRYDATLTAAQKKKNVSFMDNAGSIYSAVVNQGTSKYYSANGTLLQLDPTKRGANKQVKAAYDSTVKGLQYKIGSKIGQFTNGWYTGLNNGTFATVLAPAWMMDYIKQYAKSTSGKWDIASIPGGGGNQGGSLLTIPKFATHTQEAWDFLTWYLAPAQQERVFSSFGLFPSTPSVYSHTAIKDKKDPFFNNAPVGAIYAAGVQRLRPIVLGPKDRAIDNIIGAALSRYANGKQKQKAAWAQSLVEIKRAVG